MIEEDTDAQLGTISPETAREVYGLGDTGFHDGSGTDEATIGGAIPTRHHRIDGPRTPRINGKPGNPSGCRSKGET